MGLEGNKQGPIPSVLHATEIWGRRRKQHTGKDKTWQKQAYKMCKMSLLPSSLPSCLSEKSKM
jgi:hypothetical protein